MASPSNVVAFGGAAGNESDSSLLLPPPSSLGGREVGGVKRLIARKRDGESLTADEWSHVVAAYVAEEIPDYQMAALLMATYANGMVHSEFTALADAMLASGERLPADGHAPWIDKHSTGGVGDKVSVVLAPLVASCGVPVPMMSGRGLGHTGGTLDKLEAIPGFRTQFSLKEAQEHMDRIGAVMFGATEQVVPADKKLYALRDATATVEAIPLIAASIMSKKLAEGLAGLVLDVKRGSGAFLPKHQAGIELAQLIIEYGAARGCRCVALITAMDRPLGFACGNALEIEEAIEALHGRGPADLMDLTYALGTEMLLLGGVVTNAKQGRQRLVDAIGSGRAADKFREIVEAQGGNPLVVDDPAVLPQARIHRVYEAPASGYVVAVEPRLIGEAVVAMGGGRNAMEDDIDPSAGVSITVKPGDTVNGGDAIASVYAADGRLAEIGLAALANGVRIAGEPPAEILPLVSHRVTADGVEELA